MQVVRTFNNELSSLYETKPPVSKAKMTQITKSAIKGLKYYKHIVQSVEKFIQKCRPEYKVPGLYVIDSIVRQSRHQFGSDKDVFAPRFAKNIVTTFQNLFKCVDEDRSKIVRVLNLWQKNAVFQSSVIQPLLDMGNPNAHNEWPLDQVSSKSPVSEVPHSASDSITHNSKSKSADLSAWKNWPQGNDESFEDNHQSYAEMSTRNLEKFTKANSTADSVQSSQSTLPVKNDSEPPQEDNTVKFNKKLLEFDYGDEDEEDETPTRNEEDQRENAPENNPLALSMAQNLLSHPEILRQLQQMQQTMLTEAFQSELKQHNAGEPDTVRDRFSPAPPAEPVPIPQSTQPISSIPYPDPLPPNVIPSYPYEPVSNIPTPQSQINSRTSEWIMDPVDMGYPSQQQQQQPLSAAHENDIIQASQIDEDHRVLYSMPGEPPLPALPPQDLDERSLVLPMVEEPPDPKNNSRSRSDSRSRRSGRHRSRSRSPRRRRSRSRSRSRSRRKRSRSRERERERQREREREREKEHGRKKRGIPPLRKNFMTVCSTTLWLGHVPKTMSEAEINSLLGEYGNVLSIDMIPPRGCAYVAMDRRQDAFRALQKLKTEKIMSSIKVAWAPGKGMKGKEYKEYWEMESGVSYIPFEKLPNDIDSLELLEEGGFIDEDSMPTHLREMRQQEKDKLEDMEISTIENTVTRLSSKDTPLSSAPIATSSMLPPTSMGMPMMGMPQMMQPPQYGMPLPGMMSNQPPMVVPLPVGVPPPNPMMMVQPPSQGVLAGTPLPVGSVPQMPHLPMQHPTIPAPTSGLTNITTTASKSDVSSASQTNSGNPVSGDATPTEEDGTIISSPSTTNPSHTLATVMSNSPVSAAHMATQFGAGMGHHGMVRPMMPVMPPVSSAGAPIPFPPPQVGFGFPPPPMRPAVPNQNMAGVIPMPNSPFQWLQKANPAFGAFGDSDMRYPVHPNNAGAAAVRQPAPPITQPSGGIDASVLANVNQPQVSTQTTNLMPLKDAGSSMTEKENESRRENASSDPFTDKNSNGATHVDAFGRSKDLSNDLRRQNKDEPRDQMGGGVFGEVDKMPRFPGPPDFQPVAGAGIRMPWMHGPPGPRFPHAFNPNVPPFPPRGALPRPMHQPMDMDFFRHQVPRMHMPGPMPPPPQQQPQQRWKNDGYPQQRNQDRYSNRRDYRDNRIEDDDQGRGHRPRDDWSHRRERWEDGKGRRNEDREESSRGRDRERGMWSEDNSSIEYLYDNKCDEKKDYGESTKDDRSVQSRQKQKSDSFADSASDLFRLQRYSKGRISIDAKMNAPKRRDNTCKEKLAKNDCTKEEISNKGETYKASTGEMSSTMDVGNTTVGESDCVVKTDESQSMDVLVPSTVKELSEDNQSSQNSNASSDPSSVKIIDVKLSSNEDRKGRERDRKRSRWGRTLSQEREFQQQMGTEKKFQDDVAITDLHQGAVPPLPDSDISSDIAMAPTSGDELLKTNTDSISLDCGSTAEQSVCPDLPVDAVSAVPPSNEIAQDSNNSVADGEPMSLS